MVKCAIALGSNLGDSLKILENSLTVLNQIPGINIKSVSSWYQTKPFGTSLPQPDYLNGCALLDVVLTPEELLTVLQATELQFGRVRTERWGARTLDLDLLLYDNLILNRLDLVVPHPRMNARAFVLVPLNEIASDWIEPISGNSIAQLAAKIDHSEISLIDLDSGSKLG
jgi:2-amino-4-hydroxy-6-hydroxymethyldihydropteridine diphosphokinase